MSTVKEETIALWSHPTVTVMSFTIVTVKRSCYFPFRTHVEHSCCHVRAFYHISRINISCQRFLLMPSNFMSCHKQKDAQCWPSISAYEQIGSAQQGKFKRPYLRYIKKIKIKLPPVCPNCHVTGSSALLSCKCDTLFQFKPTIHYLYFTVGAQTSSKWNHLGQHCQ